jgi:molecular chaperone GrpE
MAEDLKVTDRRWWARGDAEAPVAEEPKLKPTYLEELEARLAAKDAELHQLLSKYRSASEEFDAARARLRKEVAKDVERGRRSMLVSFVEVLDNLDRALIAAADRSSDPFVHGVSLVRQQFLSTLESLGVQRLDPLGQPFDPSKHEAVASVPVTDAAPDGHVAGVILPGYLMGEDVLRPAMVAVSRSNG